ncbi:MAG: GNAT family N-acetyltransferase [Flavobacteriales bacterium]|nr:GNAT family N-acetyltransferase [Flavobacteriales bacterium]
MNYLLLGEETQRLSFRLLEDSDFAAWMSLFDSEDTARFLGIDPRLTQEEQCKEWFKRSFARYEKGLGGMNAIVEKSSGNLVAQCGLLIQTVEGVERMEIGYSVLPKYRNQGYASEAAQKCRDFAFENRFWDDIISIVHIENEPSAKVAEKNGMNLRKQTEYKGTPIYLFEITRSEWLSL